MNFIEKLLIAFDEISAKNKIVFRQKVKFVYSRIEIKENGIEI